MQNTVVRLRWVGASIRVSATGESKLPGYANYFLGRDPRHWRSHVLRFATVQYRNVYPGNGLRFHYSSGQLGYDWLLRPGADPARIRVAVDGASRLSLDRRGNLLIHTGGTAIVQQLPAATHVLAGRQRAIAVHFVLAGPHTVGRR